MGLNSRIEISVKSQFVDPKAQTLIKSIREFLKCRIDNLRISRVYTIRKALPHHTMQSIAEGPFLDPILEEISGKYPCDWIVEVGFKPGVTDNAGKTAQLILEDYLKSPFEESESVTSSTKYHIQGNLTRDDVEKIAKDLLANALLEEIHIFSPQHDVEIISLDLDDEGLKALSKERQLALNLDEMRAIKAYFSQKDMAHQRAKFGLTDQPTDVELEALAQTWSEHCKHKIFNAKIRYEEEGHVEWIDSLFKTYIKQATVEIPCDWLVSVFTDNAGIIKLTDDTLLAFKVETHNSPSALDPYGGALTGVLGVNRDIMGAGIGARLIANTDVLCFAPSALYEQMPERLLHPQRIVEGVCRGIEHGGNKCGVPTVNGSITYDERYLGKPLVYCGSLGIMPAHINGKETHIKEILPGDLIVIAGGRTGKDGIHGATFSSEVFHAASSSTAVQIGDPFTQKKLHDFLIEARDLQLYRTLTDNGAGGFSSSVGELARLSGGCEIHLDRALLKQTGMAPWEILLSESQERMTLAVDSSRFAALKEIADKHEVELCDLGTFTNSGLFHVLYHNKTVSLLDLDFLHEGLPQLSLRAQWNPKSFTVCSVPPSSDYTGDLHQLLKRPNICSKESVVRQFDHEVQGASVLKPFVGICNDGPSDAAVLQPVELNSTTLGIVVAHGICPRYSDFDTYNMTACAIDEAIRNCVAVGADPSRIALLDNFCWPDPIDDDEKMAQLVRANKALYDYCKAFETPLISGKDSMKNDYKIGAVKISVPPTLLISAVATLPDITKTVSMDIKVAGDLIYVLGLTHNELGGSEYAAMKGLSGGIPPSVCAKSAKARYKALHKAMQTRFVASCHDCSDGGLAVALAETALAGGLGIDVQLNSDADGLFSESASRFVVTVNPDNAEAFESYFDPSEIFCLGRVLDDERFLIRSSSGQLLVNTDINSLKKAWQQFL